MKPDKPTQKPAIYADKSYPTTSLQCSQCGVDLIEHTSPCGYKYVWCYKCNLTLILNKE